MFTKCFSRFNSSETILKEKCSLFEIVQQIPSLNSLHFMCCSGLFTSSDPLIGSNSLSMLHNWSLTFQTIVSIYPSQDFLYHRSYHHLTYQKPLSCKSPGTKGLLCILPSVKFCVGTVFSLLGVRLKSFGSLSGCLNYLWMVKDK